MCDQDRVFFIHVLFICVPFLLGINSEIFLWIIFGS